MDDLLEGASVDFEEMSKYYYVSSWTYDEEENIPLWYMYSNELKGVRIETDETFIRLEKDDNERITNITNSDLIAYAVAYDNKNEFLLPVSYSDTLESCITGLRGFINPNIYEIGRIKTTAWEFQKEVRFRIRGINRKYLSNFGDTLYQKFSNSIINNRPNDIKHVDISFDIINLKNANFMLGPAATEDDYQQLSLLIKKYIPGFLGAIEKSSLKIRFKSKS